MDTPEITGKFSLALQLVNQTGCNVFLTGKAGSGKTTFLKYIKENSHKQTVVVAPTGVAAINAGGVTIHSFFQLSFLPYLATKRFFGSTNLNYVDKHQLLRGARLSKEKINIIKKLELLIIDEVSMVRADTLDAINDVLKYVRRNDEPFGGIQVLLIGDLFQLPPVLVEHEAQLINEYYESPFFFSSQIVKNTQLVSVELDKIFRQTDENFINVLNNVRNNNLDEFDLELLNNRYAPNAANTISEAITLTTHNYIADEINQTRIKGLVSRAHVFKAKTTGDFPEKAYPIEGEITLKEGAQIMFIKNDLNVLKRYYNGKIVTITRIDGDEIWVKSKTDNNEFKVDLETWENKNYKLNNDNNIEEEVLGTFTQFPIRLAWAITIHKSQGLTFNTAIIDTGKAFAAGQVYVALSRCTSLNGLYLLSRINNQQVFTNPQIVEFVSNTAPERELEAILEIEKPEYAKKYLVKVFNLENIEELINELSITAPQKKLPNAEEISIQNLVLVHNTKELRQVANKFAAQLKTILNQQPINEKLLTERVLAGKNYIVTELVQKVLTPLNAINEIVGSAKKTKQFTAFLTNIIKQVKSQIKQIEEVSFGHLSFGVEPTILPENKKVANVATESTYDVSLALLKEGLTIEEVAAKRDMATSTIEGHVARLVKEEKLEVLNYISEADFNLINDKAKEIKSVSLTTLKSKLPSHISFGMLKIATAKISFDS